jgi:hypothetical protein
VGMLSDSTHSQRRAVLPSQVNSLVQAAEASRVPVACTYTPAQEPEGLSAVMEVEVAVTDN